MKGMRRLKRCSPIPGVAGLLTILLILSSTVQSGPFAPPCPVPIQTYSSYQPPAGNRLQPVPTIGPPTVTVPGSVTPRSDPPIPSVSVKVRVPAESPAGKELTYRFLVENCSRANAHHVVVKATINGISRVVRSTPEPVETTPGLVWNLGTMKPCTKKEIVVVVDPSNFTELSCCARVQFEYGQCVKTRIRGGTVEPKSEKGKGKEKGTEKIPFPRAEDAKALQVRKLGPTELLLYESYSFRIEVRNNGSTTLKDVVLKDELPDGLEFLKSDPGKKDVTPPKGDNPLTWNIGSLAPGEVRSVEFDAAAKITGKLSTRVTATSAAFKAESTWTGRSGKPALQVLLSGPAQRGVGREAKYFLTVINKGDFPATNVQLIEKLLDKEGKPLTFRDVDGKVLPALTVVRISDGGREDRGNIRWNLGTLAPGERRTVNVVIRPGAAGKFENACAVSADRGLMEQDLVVTEFIDPENLLIEMEKTFDPIAVGQTTSFTLRIYNGKPMKEENVSMTVKLPEGCELMRVHHSKGVIRAEVKDGVVKLPVLESIGSRSDRGVIFEVKMTKPGKAVMKTTVTTKRITEEKAIRHEETWTVFPK